MSKEPHDSTDPEAPADSRSDVSRREFLEVTGAALAVTAVAPIAGAQTRPAADAPVRPHTGIRVTINGTARRIDVDDHWTLADLLRDHLRLTGTKLGCERGECGACTVLVDDKPVYACSYLAVWADGQTVLTVEGLVRDGKLDPLQESFIAHDAPQCGFCTSGQLMTAKALLKQNPTPSVADVRTALAGNICRCSNYNRIVEAVVAAGAASTTRPTAGGGR
jgi:xanthine dehydrogenase YagT iron-sulfur-binding subunit